MSDAFALWQLRRLANGKPVVDVPCPLCAPNCRTRANARKPVLRIWEKEPAFFTYSCARCEAKGHAGDKWSRRLPRAELQQRMREAEQHHQDEIARRIGKARWLWGQSRPAAGTIAETYLRSRGITVLPPTVRFLPARGDYPPSMLVPFGLPTEPEPGCYELGSGGVQAVHLTRLQPDGSGKAPDAEGRTKIMLGTPAGWPLALVPPNDLGGLAIAEGIEDVLSLHQATGLGAWAAGAAGLLARLAPLVAGLSCVEAVTIAVDDDDAGRRGANVLASELRRRSLEVTTIEFGEVRHEAA